MDFYSVATKLEYVLERLKVNNPSGQALKSITAAKLRLKFLKEELLKCGPAKYAEYQYAMTVEQSRRLCEELAPSAADVFTMAFPLMESSAEIWKRAEGAA